MSDSGTIKKERIAFLRGQLKQKMPVVVEDNFLVIFPRTGPFYGSVKVSIKNVKRKKAQLRSLVVSISRHYVNLSVTPGNLTISVVPKIQQLVVLLRTQGLEA